MIAALRRIIRYQFCPSSISKPKATSISLIRKISL